MSKRKHSETSFDEKIGQNRNTGLHCFLNPGFRVHKMLRDPGFRVPGIPGLETLTGILMWSEPFIIKRGEEEVAVLLMDTQGAFDRNSTVKDWATVFALSTMLSSMQIYNLSGQIQEDDLQHLQYFTDYGRLAIDENGLKPFQVLQFLVRDWQYPYNYRYGDVGGSLLLDRRLQVSDQPELKQLRDHLRLCFQRIICYLMPHPGKNVAANGEFHGQLKDINEEFQIYLKSYIALLLNPQNLVVKKINGVNVTGEELLKYFKAYMEIFRGDTLPEPKSVYIATAEVNHMVAVANSVDLYSKEMELFCGHDKPYLKPEQLERKHQRCVEMALDSFNQTRKMGGAEFSKRYSVKLEKELEELHQKYIRLNDSKPHTTIGEIIKVVTGVVTMAGGLLLRTATSTVLASTTLSLVASVVVAALSGATVPPVAIVAGAVTSATIMFLSLKRVGLV